METIFIALSNMSGIACASDRDHTIYQLSKNVPLALAVRPTSPIPWDGIIDVAVISKNDGFTWLNRKSWYHHKDVGGRYGKLGV